MAVLDAKLPAWQASTKAVSTTKAEAKLLEGKGPLIVDGGGGLPTPTRLLLKDQPTASQNGLWAVIRNECVGGDGTVGGTGKVGVGETWALERPEDADSGADVTNGMLVPIEDGETNRKTSWIQRTADPIEVGTTAQVFEALLAGSRGTAGGDLVGTYSKPSIAEAVVGTNQMVLGAIGPTELSSSAKELSPQLVSPAPRKINSGSATIEWAKGSNNSKEIEVEHGLGVVPQAVIGNFGFNASFVAFAAAGAYSSTKFLAQGYTPTAPAEAKQSTFKWIAFG